jgi:hypothetical protein
MFNTAKLQPFFHTSISQKASLFSQITQNNSVIMKIFLFLHYES